MLRARVSKAIADIESKGYEYFLQNVRSSVPERSLRAEELTGDFRKVRDEFDHLNRGLRQSLMENEGSRGDVLKRSLLAST